MDDPGHIKWTTGLFDLARDVFPLTPVYLHLVASALFPIYTGAYASLSRPSSAAKPAKPVKPKDSDESEDEEAGEDETPQKMEGLSPEDAIVFPLTAGAVLTGLYFLIKWYGADMINLILRWYFVIVGVYSVGQFFNDALLTLWGLLLPDYYVQRGTLWRVSTSRRQARSMTDPKMTRNSPLVGWLGALPLPAFVRNFFWRQRGVLRKKYAVKASVESIFDFSTSLTRHNVFAGLAGIAVVVFANFVAGPDAWYWTNIQGFAVSYGALQLMSPTSFATGSMVLVALFAYDIWAVFFTPLMVTVATSLEVPIKLVFPRSTSSGARAFSMLGLGDIVIPGLMIAMALRFDLYVHYLKLQKKLQAKDSKPDSVDTTTGDKKKAEIHKAPYVPVTGRWGTRLFTRGADQSRLPASLTTAASFPKPYFTAALTGYTVGLVATLLAMHVARHAQPALLYLVPAVLSSLWGTSWARGELGMMWDFTEGLEEEEVKTSDEAKKEKAAGGKAKVS